jgi:hypothetical protein
MKKMLKRADGSKSQRGLWDNIRAKAASNKKAGKKGKAPSDAMLEQERKITEMKMGGDWMQSSKELKFGGPSKPKKYQTAPPTEGDIKLPTDTTTPTYTWTVADQKGEYTKEVKSSGESRGGRTAGSGKGFGQKQACIGENCGKVVAGGSSYAGGSGTNYTGKGAQGLSMKPKIDRSRIVTQTAEEKAAGLANEAKYKAEAKARMDAKKQEAFIRSGKGMRSTGTEDTSEDLFTKYNYTPNFRESLKKFGGKRKSTKK